MTAITQGEPEQLELAAELNFDEEQNELETDDFDLKSISQVVVYNTQKCYKYEEKYLWPAFLLGKSFKGCFSNRFLYS